MSGKQDLGDRVILVTRMPTRPLAHFCRLRLIPVGTPTSHRIATMNATERKKAESLRFVWPEVPVPIVAATTILVAGLEQLIATRRIVRPSNFPGSSLWQVPRAASGSCL